MRIIIAIGENVTVVSVRGPRRGADVALTKRYRLQKPGAFVAPSLRGWRCNKLSDVVSVTTVVLWKNKNKKVLRRAGDYVLSVPGHERRKVIRRTQLDDGDGGDRGSCRRCGARAVRGSPGGPSVHGTASPRWGTPAVAVAAVAGTFSWPWAVALCDLQTPRLNAVAKLEHIFFCFFHKHNGLKVLLPDRFLDCSPFPIQNIKSSKKYHSQNVPSFTSFTVWF